MWFSTFSTFTDTDRKVDDNFKANLSFDLYFIRGIAIFLVIIGHVVGKSDTDGIRQLYSPPIFSLSWLGDFIYTFHMPVFFIVSGIAFSVFSNKNASYISFFKSKFIKLFIPLVCWVPPFFILHALIKHQAFNVTDLVCAVIFPYDIFWFIHALIFATIFAFICFKVLRSQSIYYILSIIVFAIYLQNYSVIGGYNYIIYWNILYTSGVFIAHYLPRVYSIMGKLSVISTLAILALGITLMNIVEFSPIKYDLTKIINGLIAFLLMYAIAITGRKIVSLRKSNKLLQLLNNNIFYLGKISLVIYVLHIYFVTSMRILLIKFGITQPIIHLVLGCLAATLGPVIIYKLLQKRSRVFRYSLGEG